MLRLLAIAAGLAVGVGVGAMGGCDRLCETRSALQTGAYGLDPDERASGNFDANNYELVVAADRSTVIERFRVGDQHYELTYAVTRAVRH
jgi:hypothetical protein